MKLMTAAKAALPRKRTWLLCLLAAAALLHGAAGAQETLTLKSNLANISFVARDAAGALVNDLARDQMQVFEDGVPQKIAFFAKADDVPLTLGLLMDMSGSQDRFAKQHREELRVFLEQVLGPRDRFFLLCFGNHLRLVSDFTGSGREALDHLAEYQKHGGGNFPEIGPAGEDREQGTAFYDALFYSATGKLAGQPGRRAVLLFSDGDDNASARNMMETIEAAQAANVQVYTIRYTEAKHGRLNPRNRYGKGVMERVAKETGGATIDGVAVDPRVFLHEIAGELRATYELAYYPTHAERDGTFRKIQLRSTREGVSVRSRTGYFAR